MKNTDKMVLIGCFLAILAVYAIGYFAQQPDTQWAKSDRWVVVPCTTDTECADLNPGIEPF